MESPKVKMMSLDDFVKVQNSAVSDRRTRSALYSTHLGILLTRGLGIPVVENLDAEILRAIDRGGELYMRDWHGPGSIASYDDDEGGLEEEVRAQVCGTTHCRAGWAIHLAGEAGFQLELAVGPEHAGAAIYLASTGSVPDFFDTDEGAMEDIRACAAADAAGD